MTTKPHRTPVDSDTTQQSIDATSHTHYDTPTTAQGTSSGTVATVGDSARQVGVQEDVQTVINTLRVKRKRFTIALALIAVLIGPIALVLANLMKHGAEAFSFSILFMMALGLLTSVFWFRHSGISEEIAELESISKPNNNSQE